MGRAPSKSDATAAGGVARRRVPRQARSRQRVGQILAAARQLLIEDGPEALNTNRIAKEAAVPVGSVYEYFPDKHAIALALLDDLSDQETAQIMGLLNELADAPLPEVVRAVVDRVFHLYRQHYGLYRSLWSMTSVVRQIGNRPGEQMIVDHVKRLLAPLADTLQIRDLDLTCWTAFHLVESLALQMAGQTDFAPEACVQEISCAALRYLQIAEVK